MPNWLRPAMGFALAAGVAAFALFVSLPTQQSVAPDVAATPTLSQDTGLRASDLVAPLDVQRASDLVFESGEGGEALGARREERSVVGAGEEKASGASGDGGEGGEPHDMIGQYPKHRGQQVDFFYAAILGRAPDGPAVAQFLELKGRYDRVVAKRRVALDAGTAAERPIFDEPGGGRIARRIGTVTPLQQNRDGAAIRHATTKLMGRAARTKLLVLISDGKPLDDGYADEYALEDTKMALREARMQGIDPFCLTVDREASDYLRRMYGEVRFLIVDRAEALPERLPRVYRSLTA